jgi:hypothetical protein
VQLTGSASQELISINIDKFPPERPLKGGPVFAYPFTFSCAGEAPALTEKNSGKSRKTLTRNGFSFIFGIEI